MLNYIFLFWKYWIRDALVSAPSCNVYIISSLLGTNNIFVIQRSYPIYWVPTRRGSCFKNGSRGRHWVVCSAVVKDLAPVTKFQRYCYSESWRPQFCHRSPRFMASRTYRNKNEKISVCHVEGTMYRQHGWSIVLDCAARCGK